MANKINDILNNVDKTNEFFDNSYSKDEFARKGQEPFRNESADYTPYIVAIFLVVCEVLSLVCAFMR